MVNAEEIQIIWINNSNNKQRKENMLNILSKYFPNNKHHHVEAIIHSPKYQGITMAHIVALLKGIDSKKPFIILEDDIVVNVSLFNIKTLEQQLNILTKDPDVVYLGISNWGTKFKNGYSNIFKKNTDNAIKVKNTIYLKNGGKLDEFNDYFVKVLDMYSAHAILYLSIEYAVKTLKYCIMAVSQSKPHDIYLVELMKTGYALALKNPWFYQSAHLGGQENDTNFKLIDIKDAS